MDHYRFLGVARTATPEEIKAAYHRLAKKWHPDKNPGRKEEATRRFKELGNAYDVLKDPIRRQAYDASLGNATPSGQKRKADAPENTANKKAKPYAAATLSDLDDFAERFISNMSSNCSFRSTTYDPSGAVTNVSVRIVNGKKVTTTRRTDKDGKTTETVKTENQHGTSNTPH